MKLFVEHIETSSKTVTYQAVNAFGDKVQNVEDGKINAVTWGVFPGQQVVQPTVVDPKAFLVWKDEALKAFETWSIIYKK